VIASAACWLPGSYSDGRTTDDRALALCAVRAGSVELLAAGIHRDLFLDVARALTRLTMGPACRDELPGPAARTSATANLVLVSRAPSVPLSHRHRSIGDAILNDRGSVLLLPHAACPLFFGGRALIIWDGSISAVAALHQALPLLANSAEILMADVTDEGAHASVGHAIDRLESLPGHRRIDVTSVDLPSAPLILEAARMTRADYLVIGGFGRWNILPGVSFGNADAAFLRARLPILIGQ
jgi:hypothetical protein